MLSAGQSAPEFSLPSLDRPGQTDSLASWLGDDGEGSLLLVFFKISCPVCQFAMPFLERIHKAARGSSSALRILAISQDDADATREFHDELAITIPTALDARPYAVSRDFRIDHVPSMFLVGSGRRILSSETGFSKPYLERLAEMATGAGTAAAAPLFLPGERIPNYRPG